MTITDLVAPEAILPALKVNSKKQALQELAARAAALTGQNERAVFEVLLQREKLGTTAVGYGVAIPHGKLPKLEKLFGLFARLERPIDFEAMDGQPVDLVFLLLAPEGAGADHLKALARIARLLRDQDVAKKLRASRDAQAIYSVLALPPASARSFQSKESVSTACRNSWAYAARKSPYPRQAWIDRIPACWSIACVQISHFARGMPLKIRDECGQYRTLRLIEHLGADDNFAVPPVPRREIHCCVERQRCFAGRSHGRPSARS